MSTHASHPHQLAEPNTASLDRSLTSRHHAPSPFPHRLPTITHYQHPIIQRIHSLRRRGIREKSGLYYVEGVRFVLQAIHHHAIIEAIVVCRPLLTHSYAQQLVRQQRQMDVPILEVAPSVMRQLTLVDDSQGIGAVVRQQWEELTRITPGDELCWIALHLVRSAGNLGTILRTSEAVGGAGIILVGNAVDPYDPASVRATMGALYRQRLVRTTRAELARWKQQHRCLLIGTSPTAPTDYRAFSYRAPVILLMGEERKGLPSNLQALCDHVVHIPMVDGSDSLNLGVATGVMLYELFNQRR